MPVDGLAAGIDRLRRAGAAPYAIEAFARAHERLRTGERGWLRERDLEPVGSVPDLEDDDPSVAELDGVAVVRLNGGLGTTMGATAGKGRLEVRAGRSFVDLAVAQAAALRAASGAAVPLILLNRGSPRGPAGSPPPDPARGWPAVVHQTLLPRLRARDLVPVDWPLDPSLEWAPAGHGDVFAALAASGWLAALLDGGCTHACISSIDNVAMRVDGRVVAAMRRDGIPFLMEVADRTEVDRKGGHLARLRGGGLVLRDRAQVPPDELDAFEDVARHPVFNTNTVWVDLRALDRLLAACDLVLDLPLIANRKVVDAYDPTSPEVIQIETSMGSGIAVFPGAAIRRVDRVGFNPVKTTGELLAVRSDAYVLTVDERVELAPARHGRAPAVDLDPRWFGHQLDFDERFPGGPPSLLRCDRFVVRGDIVFEAGVVVEGAVCLEHDGPGRRRIAAGTVLRG